MRLITCFFLASLAVAHGAGDGGIVFSAAGGTLPLVTAGVATPLFAAVDDWAGVRRAARDLQADFERVSGVRPTLANTPPAAVRAAIVIGTLGHSALIDDLVRRGKLDARAIAGQWEASIREVIAQPWPGVDRALVIAGSDKRGTIYGIYDLSEAIGVSPWYWWADVTPEHRDALFAAPGRLARSSPAVKYRGIFLNDEAPDLTNWVRARFGTASVSANPPVPADIANYGQEFYARIFEVLLRLRGNYLWPAMWNNAFNEDDPANARLADEFGIVMGTSHQEPMLRAQKEWDRRFLRTLGPWNYATHPELMENFWREGIQRNRAFESIVTLGLRGANDTEMAPGGPAANRALLEQIVGVQRKILAEEITADVTQVPQLWCLYKEVQDFYEAGMRVPDDVTLLWAEDNWGHVRRLPTAAERARSGGAGVYYHFDYHGGPRSYQWLNTSPLPKIWDQMSLAKQYGADRIWIVNVGHFKGYEVPTEFFLSLAWDPARWTGANLGDFLQHWAAREFGPGRAADIADLVAKYPKYNARRKPELLAPATYSLTDYREAETVVADFNALAKRAEEIFAALPTAKRDAFYELVLFPTKASALVNELYVAAGRHALYAQQGRASANDWAAATKGFFEQYLAMVKHYHRTLANGRWNHFMDQPVLGYTTWRDPPANSLDHLKLAEVAVPEVAALGVAIEGSAAAWPGSAGEPQLPDFDVFNRQHRYVEVFNRGKKPFDFTATASAPWIVLRDASGTVTTDRRILVGVDWDRLPIGQTSARIEVAGAGAKVSIALTARRPNGITPASLPGFVEANGCVAIEAEHFSRKVDAGPLRWTPIPDYSRTLSGLRAEAPVDAPAATPGKDAPCLEYRMHLFTAGPVRATAITAPTLNFIPDRPVRYAVAFDDEPPQVVTLVPAGFQAQNRNREWEQSVSNNARATTSHHVIAQPGDHTLKVWMVDPGVVLQKLIVDTGGLRPSYLGPPESFRGPASISSP